jgi:dolichyl-phosphate-mannose-protein mannosyltransferase
MKILKSSKSLFVFYILLIFVLNVLQSAYTELIDDEAYYWLWSQKLAWGYFDHPPMVALWIKISSLFFSGELGVRFFSALMFSGTVFYIWKLISDKDKENHIHLFFLLLTAVILFNVYGFITVPDTPLFFFMALFLYAYKRFLEIENLKWSLVLGFAMAGMLYSKYHGILVIGFVVLSNLSLLKKRSFWTACLFAFVLFLPHLYWQYNNGYPSLVYHLNRSKKLYQFKFTLLHFFNQILIVGLAFPVLYYAFFKSRFKEKLNRAMLFILVGFIGFFFLSTFKTSTQPQWTAAILIPLIVVAFPYFIKHKKARRVFIILGCLNLAGLIYVRIALANESLSFFRWETHQNKQWVKELKENTNGAPIVFEDSFQNASKYKFYTGVETFSYNSLYYRQNQYDLFDFEKKLQGQTVYTVGNNKNWALARLKNKDLPNSKERDIELGEALFIKRNKIFYGTKIDSFLTFKHLKCVIDKPRLYVKNLKKINLEFNLVNTYDKTIDLKHITFYGVFQTKKHKITGVVKLHVKEVDSLNTPKQLLPKKTYKVKTTFKIPTEINPSTATFRVGLSFYNLPPGFEGNTVKIHF